LNLGNGTLSGWKPRLWLALCGTTGSRALPDFNQAVRSTCPCVCVECRENLARRGCSDEDFESPARAAGCGGEERGDWEGV